MQLLYLASSIACPILKKVSYMAGHYSAIKEDGMETDHGPDIFVFNISS